MKRIEDAFKEFTSRDDVAIVMINQFIANMIRHLISNYSDVRAHAPAFFLFCAPSLLYAVLQTLPRTECPAAGICMLFCAMHFC